MGILCFRMKRIVFALIPNLYTMGKPWNPSLHHPILMVYVLCTPSISFKFIKALPISSKSPPKSLAVASSSNSVVNFLDIYNYVRKSTFGKSGAKPGNTREKWIRKVLLKYTNIDWDKHSEQDQSFLEQ